MKILIVEDYAPFVVTLTSLLARLAPGATVRSVHTIADAEDAIFQDGAPDIILLDIGLPDSQGFNGLRKLLEAAPEASIGMISADSASQTVRGAFAEGARAYIPKSLAPEEFEAGMAKFLTVGFFVPADSLA
jgi:DNA-binding NarL/FixJ family response regulator